MHELLKLIINYTSPEQLYMLLFKLMYSLCEMNGWGDPFSYARSREIYTSNLLGHRIHDTFSGPDAHSEDGAVEYKSTVSKEINATYNGISLQDSWEKQLEYLKTKKIGCYKWHYFTRFEKSRIVEVWRMSGDKVLELLLPGLEKQFNIKKNKKDPRLGGKLTYNQITTYGERIDIQSLNLHHCN
jgi:hypothetical protein